MSETNSDEGTRFSSQNPESSFDPFNETVVIPTDEDGGEEIDFLDDQNTYSSDNEEFEEDNSPDQSQANSDVQKPEGAKPNENEEDEESFIDEEGNLVLRKSQKKDNDESGSEEQSEDDLIKKLAAKGYKVEKAEEADEATRINAEVSKIESDIASANDFLNWDDEAVIKQKITQDFISKYKREQKGHLINQEEFLEDVENELDEVMSNNVAKKLFAENVRRDVKDFLREQEGKKENLTSKKNQIEQEAMQKREQSLEAALQGFHKEGFLGLKVDPKTIKEAYDSVTKGDLANDIKNNPALAGEFGLYLKIKSQLAEALNKPTYGEGVKAAFESLNGTKGSTKNPLHTRSTNPNKSEAGDMIRRFGAQEQSQENQNGAPKPKRIVAGKVRRYN